MLIMSQWFLTCSASWLTWMNGAKFWRHQIPFSVLYVQARSQVSWWSRIWRKQQQLVQPGGVLIPTKHVLPWSQNGMRIKHVLILIQHAFKTWPRRQRVPQKGYQVEHFFIWHHCSCSPIPSMCNTTAEKNNSSFWRSNPMPTLKLSATIKSEMLEIQYYRWMAGHISYSSVVFGLGNSEARKQQNALWTCHDSPAQKPELIWNCATRLCLVICALLPTPTTKVMLGKVCVVIYDKGSAWWGTSKYKGKIRSGLGFKMQEKKKLVTSHIVLLVSVHWIDENGSTVLHRNKLLEHQGVESGHGRRRDEHV